jgi:hypothetical protein
MLYGKSWELNLLKPETNLRQFTFDLHPSLSKYRNVKKYKIQVEQIQGRHFMGKEQPCGLPHNLAKGL